ncbi:MAG: hypothetical protein ACO265_04695 [Polynucleobacter sp.]
MHLSNDALHRILSVPTVDTAGVVSYQLQDLWISPAAMVTAGLTTLQASQLLSDGVFWRLEPIVFCDQAALDLGVGVEFPEGFYGVKSAASQYASQYELTCRTGIFNQSFFGNPILQKASPTYYTTAPPDTIVTAEIGYLKGSLPYVYKPLKVSKVAFSKLTEWPHGFSIKREIEYANEYADNVINYSDPAFDSIGSVTTEAIYGLDSASWETLYNAVTIAPIGLDEGGGTIDEKFFTFAPKLELSELNTAVFQTLTEPNAIGWNYTPLEAKTTSQPFPTNTTTQIVYITQEVVKLFPLDTSPIAPLGTSDAAKLKTQQIYNLRSAEVQYLRDTATNHCSQFDWASQSRDFDAVALRQRRLLDFNAIPIAPLELGKDYATLATSPDMGLQCYGDLPALAWAPDPADESKVFALCRYRPPIRVPLPDWEWEDIGLPAYAKDIVNIDREGYPVGPVVALPEKKPYRWVFQRVDDPNPNPDDPIDPDALKFFPVYIPHTYEKVYDANYDYSKRIWKFQLGRLQHYIEGFCDPRITEENKESGGAFEIANSFCPAFSKKQCVELAPRVVYGGFTFSYLIEQPQTPPMVTPPIIVRVSAVIFLLKKRNGSTYSYDAIKNVTCIPTSEATNEKRIQVEADLEGFRTWAESFYLSESSYTEIGRYRWLDENDKAMVDEPFYGHSTIFNSFNIDIKLTPEPA